MAPTRPGHEQEEGKSEELNGQRTQLGWGKRSRTEGKKNDCGDQIEDDRWGVHTFLARTQLWPDRGRGKGRVDVVGRHL